MLQQLEGVRVIGQECARLVDTSCMQFSGCDAEGLLMALDIAGIAISAGSACSSGAIEPSPILLGMGMHPTEAKVCPVFLWSHNDAAQIDCLVEQTIDAVQRMRA
ncbi:MAG: aminotransferase class V-fold PLP-dependent enzyme [Myxococcota bacterium]